MIFQTAGVLGINPGPFSLRELIWMIEGFRVESWHHTAAALAMQANINRSKNARTYSPADFHPYITRKRPKATPGSLEALKVFVNGGKT